MKTIIVIGGGFAAVESALTLAIGLPDAQVTLISPTSTLVDVSGLVTAPFHQDRDSTAAAIPVASLQSWGIQVEHRAVESIDIDRHTVTTADGATIADDMIVVATGCTDRPESGLPLRSPADALTIRSQLNALIAKPSGNIVIHLHPEASWSVPGYETAFMADTWLRSLNIRDRFSVAVITAEYSPCSLLHRTMSERVAQQLQVRDIKVSFGQTVAPTCHTDDPTVVIEFGGLYGRPPRGLPAPRHDFRYDVALDGSIAPGIHVVGDATTFQITTAFSASQQARNLLHHLHGDLALIQRAAPNMSLDSIEFSMEFGDHSLVSHTAAPAFLRDGMLAGPTQITSRASYQSKLHGTLVHALLTDTSRLATTTRRVGLPNDKRRLIPN